MRGVLFLLILVVAGSSFALEKVVKPSLIQSDQPFTPNGSVEMDEMRRHSRIDVNKIESGSINGVSYRFFYTDGSGSFSGRAGNTLKLTERIAENWSTRCIKDAMDDSVACMATLGDLTISIHKDGGRYIVIGTSHYPGTPVSIRVNGGKPDSAQSDHQFRPPISDQILASLRNGDQVSTRYQEWPYERNIDKSFQLYGYEEVMSYLEWAISHIN